MIDTGIDYNHPDIKANYAYGKSFVPGYPDAMDQNGHGTHVAGSIAANGRVIGVGPNLKVASYRVFGPTGGAAATDVAEAIITQELNRAWYSNYGVGKIDVTAPGGDYGTKWLQTRDWGDQDPYKRCLSTIPGGKYAWYIGTSMAAPKTAALAGVIIAKHGKDVLTPAQVKHIIQTSAVDINKSGYDEEAGYGLINAVNALK